MLLNCAYHNYHKALHYCLQNHTDTFMAAVMWGLMLGTVQQHPDIHTFYITMYTSLTTDTSMTTWKYMIMTEEVTLPHAFQLLHASTLNAYRLFKWLNSPSRHFCLQSILLFCHAWLIIVNKNILCDNAIRGSKFQGLGNNITFSVFYSRGIINNVLFT